MSGIANALKNFDQFRVVSRDLTRNTLSGGVFTAIAYAALALLLVAEVSSFLRTSYHTNVLIDENVESTMALNFDIVVYDLPCKYLKLQVWDKFGEERMTTTDQFQYTTVDHTGTSKGDAYTKEEISLLEQADAATDVSEEEKKDLDSDWAKSDDGFKHTDFTKAVTFHDFTLVNFYAEWCSHCRQFFPEWLKAQNTMSEKMKFTDSDGKETTVKFMRMNCVDFQPKCQEAQIQAFPSLRLYKADGTFQQFSQKRNIENIVSFLTDSIKNSHLSVARHHSMFNEGCQVKGSLTVQRVPGHFHLAAEAFGSVNVNPALTNVSHVVNHLSFGEKDGKEYAKKMNVPTELVNHISPLDGKSFLVDRFHEAPQHYLKVVTTYVEGKKRPFYQMTHTDTIRKLNNKKDATPQARFTYDFSPMSVVVKTKQKRWYEFLTSLFAILGGTFTIVELCSGAVDSVSTVVKDAMGKNN